VDKKTGYEQGVLTGAHERDRTADLILTKDVLYQLSYMGSFHQSSESVESNEF
jgi:hypothetical protein